MKKSTMLKILVFVLLAFCTIAAQTKAYDIIILTQIHNITQNTFYDSIQQAIDDANDGDQIELSPGTYYEPINFHGKAIRLFSSAGNSQTTLNADGDDHVIQCVTGEDANTIIEGFTIEGGNANGTGINNYGGGMLNQNSSPTIKNCVFSSNNAAQSGGAMANINANPEISNCTFFENSSSVHGAGIYNEQSSPLIKNCLFESNTAGTHGGGIMNNVASRPTIINSLFALNSAGASGGGIANSVNNSSPNVINCTFVDNTASSGGGIYNYNSSPNITSCILWNDTPNEILTDSGNPVVTYSDIEGGFTGLGNINADPCFSNGTLANLDINSPCIDAGDSNKLIVAGITQDICGLNRFVDIAEIYNTGTGPVDFVDMGAYEFNRFSKKPFIIYDANNAPVRFTLTGGGWGEIINSAVTRRVILHDTTEKSQFTILTKSNIETSIHDITCVGPLKGISAKKVNLAGSVGTGPIGKLILNDVTDSTILNESINPRAAVRMYFDQVSDVTIDSEIQIKSLKLTAWHGGLLKAPSIGSITANGDRKRQILGDLTLDVVVDANIGTVKAKDTIFGDWTCNSIKSISANEFYTTDINLNQLPHLKIPALGKLSVNWLYNSKILSHGNIGKVTVGSMESSTLFAGVRDGVSVLPAAEPESFEQQALIKSIAVKGIKIEEPPYFNNTNIAAWNILSANILYPQTPNSGTPFGITADNMTKVYIKKMDGTVMNVVQSWTLDDFQIRLLTAY